MADTSLLLHDVSFNERSDGYTLARARERTILQHINRYGWLTARDVGHLVWPNRTDPHQAARHVVRRLVRDKQVLVRESPRGIPVYVLSTAGARLLSEAGIPATDGRRIRVGGQSYHRHLSNAYLIDQELNGFLVRTEHQIGRGETPAQKLLGCIPDGLILRDAEAGECSWIEVETARKPTYRRSRFRSLASSLSGDRMEPLGTDPLTGHVQHLHELVFVADEAPLLRAVGRDLAKENQAGRLSELGLTRIQLVLAEHTSGLIYGGELGRWPLWEVASSLLEYG